MERLQPDHTRTSVEHTAQSAEQRTQPEEQTLSFETYDFFRTMLEGHGFSEFNFVAEAYAQLPNETYVVRRENPTNISTLLENGSYAVTFNSEKRYSNCVTWQPSMGPRGIQNAYLEGYTHLNSVVTVIGFTPTESADIEQLSDATSNFHGLQRELVRSFQGTVTLAQVAFISLRIPGHLLPHQELTEDEAYFVEEYEEKRDNGEQAQPVMVHRVFLAPQKETGDI